MYLSAVISFSFCFTVGLLAFSAFSFSSKGEGFSVWNDSFFFSSERPAVLLMNSPQAIVSSLPANRRGASVRHLLKMCWLNQREICVIFSSSYLPITAFIVDDRFSPRLSFFWFSRPVPEGCCRCMIGDREKKESSTRLLKEGDETSKRKSPMISRKKQRTIRRNGLVYAGVVLGVWRALSCASCCASTPSSYYGGV